MADFTLIPTPPIAGPDLEQDTLQLRLRNDLALVSIATPLGGERELAEMVNAAFSAEVPVTGYSSASTVDDTWLLGLQRDQIFAMFRDPGDDPVAVVSRRLGAAGYYTDQSDSWVILELSGADSLRLLERICPLDLNPSSFPGGAVARTVIEHFAVILLRTGPDTFLLLSPRSFAESFAAMIRDVCRSIA